MKKFDKVYVDMDGVIADFDGQFEKLVGGKPHEFEDKYGTERFWDAILEHRDFFATIAPFPHLRSLLDMCHEMSDNVVILSSPSKFNTSICVQQKRDWLDKHGCHYLAATFEKEKWKFARGNCLLIDDWEKNISKWEANGGVTHHFKSFDGFVEFFNNWRDK